MASPMVAENGGTLRILHLGTQFAHLIQIMTTKPSTGARHLAYSLSVSLQVSRETHQVSDAPQVNNFDIRPLGYLPVCLAAFLRYARKIMKMPKWYSLCCLLARSLLHLCRSAFKVIHVKFRDMRNAVATASVPPPMLDEPVRDLCAGPLCLCISRSIGFQFAYTFHWNSTPSEPVHLWPPPVSATLRAILWQIQGRYEGESDRVAVCRINGCMRPGCHPSHNGRMSP